VLNRKLKIAWHNTNDRIALTVEHDLLIDYARVGIEAAGKQPFTQDDHPAGLGQLVFTGKEGPAQQWSSTQHRKQIGSDHAARNAHRLAAACHNEIVVVICGDVLKHVILIAQVEEVGIGV